MNATQEEWRPIVGWEGHYEVSSLGRVRSVDRILERKGSHRTSSCQYLRRGRLLKPFTAPGNYPHVNLRAGDRHRAARVHVLVLEAFVGPRPDGWVACHNDGDHENNRLSNLRWDTYSSNNFDLVKHGTHWHARKKHCKHGHEFTPENTIIRSNGGRKCRQCQREANKRSYAKYGRKDRRAA